MTLHRTFALTRSGAIKCRRGELRHDVGQIYLRSDDPAIRETFLRLPGVRREGLSLVLPAFLWDAAIAALEPLPFEDPPVDDRSRRRRAMPVVEPDFPDDDLCEPVVKAPKRMRRVAPPGSGNYGE